MRLIVPDEISSLTDIFAPYMIKNNDGTALVLREDAPEEVKEAQNKYHEWWKTHYIQD